MGVMYGSNLIILGLMMYFSKELGVSERYGSNHVESYADLRGRCGASLICVSSC